MSHRYIDAYSLSAARTSSHNTEILCLYINDMFPHRMAVWFGKIVCVCVFLSILCFPVSFLCHAKCNYCIFMSEQKYYGSVGSDVFKAGHTENGNHERVVCVHARARSQTHTLRNCTLFFFKLLVTGFLWPNRLAFQYDKLPRQLHANNNCSRQFPRNSIALANATK